VEEEEELFSTRRQRQRRPRDRQRGRRRFFRRRKTCVFCEEKVSHIDYKKADSLRSFLLTDRGKIRPRRQTGTCAKHQRQLSLAVKRARHLAMLPFVVKAKPGQTR